MRWCKRCKRCVGVYDVVRWCGNGLRDVAGWEGCYFPDGAAVYK